MYTPKLKLTWLQFSINVVENLIQSNHRFIEMDVISFYTAETDLNWIVVKEQLICNATSNGWLTQCLSYYSFTWPNLVCTYSSGTRPSIFGLIIPKCIPFTWYICICMYIQTSIPIKWIFDVATATGVRWERMKMRDSCLFWKYS